VTSARAESLRPHRRHWGRPPAGFDPSPDRRLLAEWGYYFPKRGHGLGDRAPCRYRTDRSRPSRRSLDRALPRSSRHQGGARWASALRRAVISCITSNTATRRIGFSLRRQSNSLVRWSPTMIAFNVSARGTAGSTDSQSAPDPAHRSESSDQGRARVRYSSRFKESGRAVEALS
jgi:hypothetical protein